MGLITDINTAATATEARRVRKLLEQRTPPETTYLPAKHIGTAYALCVFLGWFGVHHFYLGKTGRGIGYLLTFGWLGVGVMVDLFLLPYLVRGVNRRNGHGATMTPLRSDMA